MTMTASIWKQSSPHSTPHLTFSLLSIKTALNTAERVFNMKVSACKRWKTSCATGQLAKNNDMDYKWYSTAPNPWFFHEDRGESILENLRERELYLLSTYYVPGYMLKASHWPCLVFRTTIWATCHFTDALRKWRSSSKSEAEWNSQHLCLTLGLHAPFRKIPKLWQSLGW